MRVGLDLAVCTAERGGIGRYAEELARALLALASAGEQPLELALFPGNPAPSWLLGAAARSDEWPAPKARVDTRYTHVRNRVLRANLLLGPQLGRMGLDVFHSPDNLSLPLTGGRKVALVATIHDLIPILFPETVTHKHRLVWNTVLGLVVRRADRLITVSHATACDLAERFPRAKGKIRVIYPGVDPRFAPAPPEAVATVRQRLGLPDDYLLFVGTIEPKKNLSGLFEAYSILHRRHRDVPRLVVAGKRGWMSDPILRKVGELGLDDHILFRGFVPDDELPALFTGAMLFLFPSLYEGFGLPVLEAMACGTPVVTSSRASLPEVAGDAGVLVDPTDTEAIAEAIENLLEDSQRRHELSQRGRLRAQAFRWEETARQTLQAYQEATATP